MSADTGIPTPITTTPDVKVTATNGDTPPTISNGVQLNKRDETDEYHIGGGVLYYIYHGSLGGQEVTNYVVEDMFPKEFIFEDWRHGRPFNAPLNFTVEYQTTLTAVWTAWPGGPFSTDDNSFHNVSELSLAANEYVTGLRFNFGTVPAGLDYHYDTNARIEFLGDFSTIHKNGLAEDRNGDPITVTDPATIVSNTGTLSTDQYADVSDTESAPIADPKVWVDIGKSFEDSSPPYRPGDIVRIELQAQLPPESVGDFVNPTFWDLLPPEMEFVGNIETNSNYDTGANLTPVGGTMPYFEAFPDWNGTGRTLLKFWWDATNPLTVHSTTRFSELRVYYDVQIPWTTADGTYLNEALGTAESLHYCEPDSDPDGPDTHDFDEDGDTTERFCYGSESFDVFDDGNGVGLDSQKWVRGQLDAGWSRFPEHGETVPGGQADYELRISNPGSVGVKDIVVIDILPHVGDRGVVDLNLRSSEWEPVLAGPVSVNGALPPGISAVTVYYSTSSNPQRDELTPGIPIGAEPPNWNTTPPADITAVKSLKFELTGTLAPTESLILAWPMRAPLDAPTAGEIAWNSFGYVATNAVTDSQLLASEPVKVGIAVSPAGPAYYGDYVWYDSDRDGIQDAAESGINSVRVELYQPSGATPDPDNDTLVAFTVTQNDGSQDGAYLFSNLAAGDYYAVFYPPTGYSASPTDAGSDDAVDSDGTAGNVGATAVWIAPITTLGATSDQRTWDQGFYDASAAEATIGDRIWIDGNGNDLQDGGEGGVAGVTVGLFDMDNGGIQIGESVTDASGYYLFGGPGSDNMFTHIVNTPVTQCVAISSSRDDLEEPIPTATPAYGSSDIELGQDGSGDQIAAFRFLELNIPQGATISEAYVQFTTDDDSDPNGGGSTTLDVRFWGEDTDSSVPFTDSTKPSTRTRTTATADWTIPLWSGNSVSGPDQRSADLSAVIQEIVDRGGWVPGNDLSLFIEGLEAGERETESVDEIPGSAAQLCVTWLVPQTVAYTIDPGTNYEVRIDTTQGALSAYTLVTPNAGGDSSNSAATDVTDSDAVLSGGDAEIVYVGDAAGTYNMGLDFGFSPPACDVFRMHAVSSDHTLSSNGTGINQPTYDIWETINGQANAVFGYDVTNYEGTSTPFAFLDDLDISYRPDTQQFHFSVKVEEVNGEVDAFWFVFGRTGNPRNNAHTIFYIDAYNDSTPKIYAVPYDTGWADASFAATWDDSGTPRPRALASNRNANSGFSEVSASYGTTETYTFTLDATAMNDRTNWDGSGGDPDFGLDVNWDGIQFDQNGVGVWFHAFTTTGAMPAVNDPVVGWAIDPASDGNGTFPWPGALTDPDSADRLLGYQQPGAGGNPDLQERSRQPGVRRQQHERHFRCRRQRHRQRFRAVVERRSRRTARNGGRCRSAGGSGRGARYSRRRHGRHADIGWGKILLRGIGGRQLLRADSGGRIPEWRRPRGDVLQSQLGTRQRSGRQRRRKRHRHFQSRNPRRAQRSHRPVSGNRAHRRACRDRHRQRR